MLAALALSACAGDSTPLPDAEPASPRRVPVQATADALARRLVGTEWDLVSVADRPVLERTFPTLRFAQAPPGVPPLPGQIEAGGFDGCNRFGLRIRLDGDRVETGDLLSQMVDCLPAVVGQASSITTALVEAARLRLSDDRLDVLDSAGTTTLSFRSHPDRSVDVAALHRGRWRLVLVETPAPPPGPPMLPPLPMPPPPPGPAPPPESPPPPLGPTASPLEVVVTFGANGAFRGTAGCRTFEGTYGLRGDDLTLSSYRIDSDACTPSERSRTVEIGLTGGEIDVSDRRLAVHAQGGGLSVFVRP